MQTVIRKFMATMLSVSAGLACQAQSAAPAAPAAGAAMSAAPQAGAAPSAQQTMLISAGDVVNVTVSNSADFTMKVRVDMNGDVVLPYIGQQHFGGKTVEQVQETLGRQLKDQQYFTDPQVLVFVEQFTSESISVLGEVNKPGSFPSLGDHNLYEILGAAGGLTPLASPAVLVYRRGQEKPLSLKIAAGLKGDDPAATFPVYGGDRIVVPKNGVVYVVGAVKTPNAFPLPNDSNLTLVRALTLAGGTLRTAKRGQVHLVRQGDDARVDIPVDLGKVLAGKVPDMQMKADDIIYVPDSYAKIIAAGSASVIGAAINATAYLQR